MVYYFLIDLMVIVIMILDLSQVELTFWKLLIYFKAFLLQTVKEEIAIAVKGRKIL